MLSFSHRATRDQSGACLPVRNPATGLVFAEVALATEAEAMAAAVRAAAAQPLWAARPQIERADALRGLVQVIRSHADEIAVVLAQESGKSLEDSRAEIHYACEITLYHAEWARRLEGELIPSDSTNEMLILQHEPIGVVVCLIPFNFPIYTLFRKIAPALMAGNAVVVRPSDHTPCSALVVARLVAAAGFPSNLVQIMAMQNDSARALCVAPSVGMITLTGSVAAGRHVLEYCKVNIAKPSLELGGKTPVIVAVDADIALAVRLIVAAKRAHCGQVCTSPERVYADIKVYDALVSALRDAFNEIEFGDRAEEPSCMGPVVDAAARLRTHEAVIAACAAGARLETGGYMPPVAGFFYPATLLSDCTADMEIMHQELFAPVLAIMPVSGIEEALTHANNHHLGLTAMLFTESYRTAMHVATRIQAGELLVNRAPADPYQGYHAGWKQSGLGGDDGKHGIYAYTQTRLVTFKF